MFRLELVQGLPDIPRDGRSGTGDRLDEVRRQAAPERRSRVYGLFYTIGIGTGALAPPLFGLLSDAAGVPVTLAVLAAVILATLPLAHLLRPAVEGKPEMLP